MSSKFNSGKSLTRFQFREINFKWTLENFSICNKKNKERLESEIFPKLDTDKCEWRIKLYPYGETEESKDYISIYVECIAKPNNTVVGTFKYNLQDVNGKIIKCSSSATSEFKSNNKVWGHSKFTKRSEVVALLEDDILVVDCTVKWQDTVVSESLDCDNENVKLGVQHSVLNDFHELLENSTLSDVCLLAKDNVKIHAHKCILAARSPILAAMFQSNAKERPNSVVEVDDMNSNVLKIMLKFVYSGKFINDQCPIEDLLAAAKKYAIEDLKARCEQELGKKLTVENAVNYLLLANRCKAKTLKEQVLKLITTNLRNVLKTEAMKNLSITQTSVFYDLLEAVADKMQE